MHESQPDHLEELNALAANRDHLVVKARLLRSAALDQKETEFIDISSEADLVLAMLLPARTADDLSPDYPEICQIQVGEKDKPATLFHIHWLGKGRPLYSVNDFRHRYTRTGPSFPEGGEKYDKHLDEALAFCGLVKAIAEGDDKGRSSCEKSLRFAVGLSQEK